MDLRSWTCALVIAAAALAQDSRASRPASRPSESSASVLKDLVAKAEDLDDVKRIAGLVAQAVAAGMDDENAARLTISLGFAWSRVGRDDEALACFERLGNDWPAYGSSAMLLKVGILGRRDDWAAAAELASKFVRESSGSDRNTGWSTLAVIEERRGNWQGALDAAEKWKPSDDDDAFGLRASNTIRMAKCRFHLGQPAAALRLLESLLPAAGKLHRSEAAFLYAEYAGRSGRLDEARAFVAKLPESLRETCETSMRIVEAWIAKDPAAIVKVLALEPLGEEVLRATGRLFRELGPEAVKWLEQRVGDEDPMAVRLYEALPGFVWVGRQSMNSIGLSW